MNKRGNTVAKGRILELKHGELLKEFGYSVQMSEKKILWIPEKDPITGKMKFQFNPRKGKMAPVLRPISKSVDLFGCFDLIGLHKTLPFMFWSCTYSNDIVPRLKDLINFGIYDKWFMRCLLTQKTESEYRVFIVSAKSFDEPDILFIPEFRFKRMPEVKDWFQKLFIDEPSPEQQAMILRGLPYEDYAPKIIDKLDLTKII